MCVISMYLGSVWTPWWCLSIYQDDVQPSTLACANHAHCVFPLTSRTKEKKRAFYSMAMASLLTLFAAASAWPSTTVKHTGCQPPLDDPSSNAYPRVDFARNRSRVIVGPALLLGPESRIVACSMGLELRLVRVHNLAATVLALQVLAIVQSAIAQGC